MSKRFEQFIEIIGWLRIVASPFLIGTVLGLLAWFNLEVPYGLALAIALVLLGLLLGIAWANRVRKRKSTFGYISEIYGSPDKKEET